ncbi:PREDICTED: myosin-binding protein 3-like [Lupinus angustifolius]|uniref:myosin-binding protein 3-like n=1 Tax=Lupinus angustifolius TaxID=3871 RepID=UPI00092E58E1|nr:PREDICTED: myosin-binding protein 3-like [Lupinus angustifolius]XP_019432823.1 PREDICTED: myosin-binding protein 3-like [Lupinus angustifolius]
MAGNKFATMLRRNNNKMVVILVYAVLEWVLIVLLLFNSLFSYLITKFAESVGLKPPCLWCSRVDQVLQPGKSTNLLKDLLCETHAAEISKLGYCSNHRRLTETESMCVDCLASRPNHHENSLGKRHKISFVSWESHENGESKNIKKCSCCNESLSSQIYPPYLLMNPSWGDENFTSKGSLIVESIDDEKEGDREKNGEDHDHEDEGIRDEHHTFSDIESFILREVAEDRSSSFSNLHSDGKDAEKEEKDDLIITELDPSGADNFIHQLVDTSITEASLLEDRSLELINMYFEDYVVCDTHRLTPVTLIDSITYMNFESSCKLDEDLGENEQKIQTFATKSPIDAQLSILEEASLLKMDNNAEKTSMREFESLDTSMTSLANFIVFDFEELRQSSVLEVQTQRITSEEAQISPNEDNNFDTALEEQDNKQVDLPRSQEPVYFYESTQEDGSSSSGDDAEIQNAFGEFIAQNNLSKSESLSNGDNNIDTNMEEPYNTAGFDLSLSQEPVGLCDCTDEDESSTSDDDNDDDDIEVQNAFDEFIAQNNLNNFPILSNGDNNVESATEKPAYTPQENLTPSEDLASSCQCIAEDQSSTSEDDTEDPGAFCKFIAHNNLGPDKTGANNNEYAEMVEETISVEEKSYQMSKCLESYEAEEDKLPETPRFVNGLHKKSMLFEKRESGGEESLDGSVASEVECGDPVLTIDRLKTALKAERTALGATYQELEEERSASAIATNQTMAMITRLQEEKAAMQMEALQYQRMMEEQAEYDQEALQLLNELMVKREKEKQELEKELEEYRQKVMDYESKERLRVLQRMKDGSVRSRDPCSCSCSNVDYADDHELSIDLKRETRDEDNCCEENSHNNTTADTVSNLEDMALDCVNHISVLDNSLAEFEEERASILDQLKALEEKIISLEDNEEFLDDINLIEHSSTYDENGLNEKCNFSSPEDNMYPNGFSDEKHSPKRTMGPLAKRLLPYLDAADNEAREEEANSFDTQLEPESADMQNSVHIQEMDSMKVSIEEEVDRVYERLQALETDREFLKHCVGSVQNGDKGVDLLQEILQHLRDLKTVEHRLQNLGNDPLE